MATAAASDALEPTPSDEREFALGLIRRIVDECPRRRCATPSERRAHELLGEAYEARGASVELRPFRFNTHLYAVLALTFGLAVLGTALLGVSPWLAAALHLLAAVSYLGDSTRRFYLLRRIFPFRQSQNLVATLPATGEMRLRIAVVAHADAAYTGVVFHPTLIKHATKEPPIRALRFMRKGLLIATVATFALVPVDLLAAFGVGSGGLIWGAAWLLTVPALITFVLNLDVVLRDEIVPGANDNLSGCAGGAVLCERLREDKPDDVELVFVCTGSEESGTGGAWALARDAGWESDKTVILGIDGLTNGELRLFIDGEVLPQPPPRWLMDLLLETAQKDPRFAAQVQPFEIPTGASDAMPFLARGYQGLTIGCVDPEIGAPRHYHRPSDTPDNLDPQQLMLSIDFVEQAVRDVISSPMGARP